MISRCSNKGRFHIIHPNIQTLQLKLLRVFRSLHLKFEMFIILYIREPVDFLCRDGADMP